MQKTTATLSCKLFYVSSYDNFFKKNVFFFFIYAFFIHLECFLRTNFYFFKSRFTAHVNNAMVSKPSFSNISKPCNKTEQIFSSFVESVAFSNIYYYLTLNHGFVSFGNRQINKLTDHYMALLMVLM